ncbi:amidase [Nocardioides sp. LHD-245]|uniref:amidase n=1 Tax=Nocardioides sp. LHD-245 TaxID=3051387 RepID=UPI0027DF88B5|nr:amidase [Nocardioides sp. LHD-245]
MTSAEDRVRVLLDLFGLDVDRAEIASVARDYPTLRAQADEMHRTAVDGRPRDTSVPKAFSAGALRSAAPSARVGRTIEETAADLRSGAVTSTSLVAACFDRVDRLDPGLGAFVRTFRDAAMAAAESADRDLVAGRDRGPLQGIPIAVKDIVATAEGATTANSLVAPPRWDGDADATVIARLRDAGAIITGKTTTNEFALGLNDPSKGFPMPRNAWDPRRYAGGSSSGSAIAVATGMVLGSVATDTAGSVRHPSALNGVTGLKVSRGRVPLTGVVPLSPSLDTVGPIARSARDCAHLLGAMAGHDPSDGVSCADPAADYAGALDGSVAGLRIGWPAAYFLDEGNVAEPVRAGVVAAVATLQEAGASIVEIELPHADIAKIACQVVLLSEALAYHRDELAAQWSAYGVYHRGLLARGALFSAADYVQAMKVRDLFAAQVARVLGDCDVIALPTMPTGARLLDETDPTMMDRWSGASFMSQWNLVGLPACALPVGYDGNGMPVSMQLVGRHLGEATVLRAADAFQRLTTFHLVAPAEPGR